MHKELYETSRATYDKMTAGISWSKIENVLDTCGGLGALLDYLKQDTKSMQRFRYETGNNERGLAAHADVIEIDEDCQHVLRGKGYRVVHDDFLTFQTHQAYSLILANFPFSEGVHHLRKALSMIEENGGHLRCLVNAETLRNVRTNYQQDALKRIKQLGGEIEYLEGEFKNGSRPTNVEVALIKVYAPPPLSFSFIISELERAFEAVEEATDTSTLIERSFINQAVARYKFECAAGVRIIKEDFALREHLTERIQMPGTESKSKGLLAIEIDGKTYSSQAEAINAYLRVVRRKFWTILVKDPRFVGQYTSNIVKALNGMLDELEGADFSRFNIRQLEQDLKAQLVAGVEAAIVSLFDKCTAHGEGEFSDNVWLWNGWRTNSAHSVKPRVILPMWGALDTDRVRFGYNFHEVVSDMVKALDYLARTKVDVKALVSAEMDRVHEQNKNRDKKTFDLNLRHISINVYKKGTVHIYFQDAELLKKFNIFGAQKRNWLPPRYGKVAYSEMSAEERAVVDSFQGKADYDAVYKDRDFYLADSTSFLRLNAAPKQEELF